MNKQNMLQIIDNQNEQWCQQMTYLMKNDEYENAESLYLEYVVNGEDPDEFSWIILETE
jgi:hypothetical protein